MNRMQWNCCSLSPDTRSQIAEELPLDSFSFGMLDLGTQQPCCEEVKQPYGKTTYKCLATALATRISQQSSSIRTANKWAFWWLLTPVMEPFQLIHSESEQSYPTEPCPKCTIVSKIYVVIVFKSLSFAMVSYITLDNWNIHIAKNLAIYL